MNFLEDIQNLLLSWQSVAFYLILLVLWLIFKGFARKIAKSNEGLAVSMILPVLGVGLWYINLRLWSVLAFLGFVLSVWVHFDMEKRQIRREVRKDMKRESYETKIRRKLDAKQH